MKMGFLAGTRRRSFGAMSVKRQPEGRARGSVEISPSVVHSSRGVAQKEYQELSRTRMQGGDL